VSKIRRITYKQPTKRVWKTRWYLENLMNHGFLSRLSIIKGIVTTTEKIDKHWKYKFKKIHRRTKNSPCTYRVAQKISHWQIIKKLYWSLPMRLDFNVKCNYQSIILSAGIEHSVCDLLCDINNCLKSYKSHMVNDGISSPLQALNSNPKPSGDLWKISSSPYFFLVFNHDFIIYTDFAHTGALNSNYDVTN